MSNGLLEILRYFLLALIWLFFIYAARMVWVEVRRSRTEESTEGGRGERQRKPLKLRIVDPADLADQAYDLGGEITLGRSSGCVVALPNDTFASSVHARVFPRDGELWVEDLGSTNGTFVNSRRIQAPLRLRRGDRIKVGSTVLELAR